MEQFQQNARIAIKSNVNIELTPESEPSVPADNELNGDAFPDDPATPYTGWESKPFNCGPYRSIALDVLANMESAGNLQLRVLKRNSPSDADWRVMTTVRGPNNSGVSNIPPHTLVLRTQDFGNQPLIKAMLDILCSNTHEIKILARATGSVSPAPALNLKALGGKGF